ncbi:MAG: SH3 domain-containing protein [Polyangiaceae bacterium]
MAKKHDVPFVVDLPNASADQPSWLRVGIFAIVGLVVGIGWPRVFGIRLGPSAPVSAAEAQSGARPNDPPPALPANVVAASPTASGVNPAAMTASSNAIEAGTSTVDVKHGVIISCKTDTGETLKGAACGTLDFDAIALPRLKRLSNCPTADGADGKLSVLFGLDFESNKVRIDVGRSTTIENKDTFSGCLSGSFDKVSLGAMAHDNTRYTVSYSVHFAPRGSVTPATPGAAGGTATGGSAPDTKPGSQTPSTASSPTADVAADSAEVVWQVAIVRDSPRTGNVVARLPRGSTVKIASNQEGWYRVHYGPSFGSEGWVYRASVGK